MKKELKLAILYYLLAIALCVIAYTGIRNANQFIAGGLGVIQAVIGTVYMIRFIKNKNQD